MKDNFLETAGVAYRTNTFDPSRKTLVFIHGLSGTSSAWYEFEDALQSEYNIVTYDLRGHGLSKRYRTFNEYGLTKFADDLLALLNHLGVHTCTLVAHSMGTSIAVVFLKHNAERVESILFLAPNYRLHSLARTKIALPFLWIVSKFFMFLPFNLKRGSRINYKNFGYSPDFSFKRIVPEIKDMTVRLYLYCLTHMYAFNNDTLWESIAKPTTIVHGTQDSFVPHQLGVALAKKIPNSKLVTLEQANHMLVLNNAKDIIEVLKNF